MSSTYMRKKNLAQYVRRAYKKLYDEFGDVNFTRALWKDLREGERTHLYRKESGNTKTKICTYMNVIDTDVIIILYDHKTGTHYVYEDEGWTKHDSCTFHMFQLFNEFCEFTPTASGESHVTSAAGDMVSLYNLFKQLNPDVLKYPGRIHVDYNDKDNFLYSRILNHTFNNADELRDVYVKSEPLTIVRPLRISYKLM